MKIIGGVNKNKGAVEKKIRKRNGKRSKLYQKLGKIPLIAFFGGFAPQTVPMTAGKKIYLKGVCVGEGSDRLQNIYHWSLMNALVQGELRWTSINADDAPGKIYFYEINEKASILADKNETSLYKKTSKKKFQLS